MNKKLIIGLIATVVIIVGTTFVAYANPKFFTLLKATNTSTASTTVVYMTVGTATSTLFVDSHLVNQDTPNRGRNTTAYDSLTLLVQLTATTGIPTLNIEFEDSRDGVDWYRRATTSNTSNNLITITDKIQVLWASSTASEGGSGTASDEEILNLVFDVKPQLRFTRAIMYLSSTTGPTATGNDDGGVYAELIGTKQNHER